jgi:hypothetical protein
VGGGLTVNRVVVNSWTVLPKGTRAVGESGVETVWYAVLIRVRRGMHIDCLIEAASSASAAYFSSFADTFISFEAEGT